MAREYASKGFTFIFVYVREAHPGENYGPHRSMEQKLTGQQAVDDFARMMQHWAEQAKIPGRLDV